jgi:hypothetical protein
LFAKFQRICVKVALQVIAMEKLKIPYCGINFPQKLEHRSRFQIMELASSKSSNSKP